MTAPIRRLVTVGVLATLTAAGCGGGDTTNGLENKTPAQVTREATAALRAAKSVRIAGETRDGGRLLKVDLRFQGRDTAGTMERDGQRAEIIKVGGGTFIRADRPFYRSADGGAAADLIADRWVKLAPGGVEELDDLTLDSFTRDLGRVRVTGKVERATFAGRRVVVVTGSDGSRLHVSNLGAPTPVHKDRNGAGGARIDFSDYGTDFRIAAPKDAVDVSRLR